MTWAGQAEIFREARRNVANAKLNAYRAECWRLANLARRGVVNKLDAVDLLRELALGHALVRALGEDRISGILDEAFADSDFRPMATEVA
jgi:hypothetical protein